MSNPKQLQSVEQAQHLSNEQLHENYTNARKMFSQKIDLLGNSTRISLIMNELFRRKGRSDRTEK